MRRLVHRSAPLLQAALVLAAAHAAPARAVVPALGLFTGPLGGVSYVPLGRARPLVLDCSLVYSLALAGRYLRDEGITTAVFSDAINRRFVRGTTRRSKHSYGLALDVHRFAGDRFELGDLPAERLRLAVRADDGRRGEVELRVASGEVRAVEIALDR